MTSSSSFTNLVGLSGAIGIVLGGFVYYKHKRVQRNITKGIPYQMAFKELDACSTVCNFLGRPISPQLLDLSDEENRINHKSASLKVPFAGKKRSGVLHAVVKRREEGWEVTKLLVELQYPVKEGWSRILIKDLEDSN